ncbi:MAG: hypothetical protein ACOY9J_02565 [Pseudomonadota bacterium]
MPERPAHPLARLLPAALALLTLCAQAALPPAPTGTTTGSGATEFLPVREAFRLPAASDAGALTRFLASASFAAIIGTFLLLGIGLAFTYTAAGIAVGLLGAKANLTIFLQSPPVLIAFALAFVALAMSMFGFYGLQMPSLPARQAGVGVEPAKRRPIARRCDHGCGIGTAGRRAGLHQYHRRRCTRRHDNDIPGHTDDVPARFSA